MTATVKIMGDSGTATGALDSAYPRCCDLTASAEHAPRGRALLVLPVAGVSREQCAGGRADTGAHPPSIQLP